MRSTVLSVFSFTKRARTVRRHATLSAVAATAFAVLAPVLGPAADADAASTATVTCASPSVPIYHVDALAQLRRWSYTNPLEITPGWAQQQIGEGWGGLNVFSGGSGVLYAIDSSGNLNWYKDQNYGGGVQSWDPASASTIGTGWGGFTSVFAGGQGDIYAIDSAGALHWYGYTGINGVASWAPNSGAVIGTGWNGFTTVFAGGQGIIYAIDGSGNIRWYQYSDPTSSAGTWSGGGTIGSGWNAFTQFGSTGGGIIFARDASGNLWWYRDMDPLGGSSSWANGGNGINEGTGWGPAQIVADVNGCTAS